MKIRFNSSSKSSINVSRHMLIRLNTNPAPCAPTPVSWAYPPIFLHVTHLSLAYLSIRSPTISLVTP